MTSSGEATDRAGESSATASTAPPEPEDAELAALRPPAHRYRLTRFVLLRLLGLVYLVAFLSLADQLLPLLGHDGILPVEARLARDVARDAGFLDRPSLFWLDASDAMLLGCAWLGAALSLAVALGVTNAFVMALLWALHLSFLHVGQIFWGYGWELLLAEAGFLAIFLCPVREWRPMGGAHAPSPLVIGLNRWLLLRVMLGAGLIKLRGDDCWTDLTCLDFHYETQPLPSPLSWAWHALPHPILAGGVAFNHLVELVVPFGYLGPRRLRLVCGALTIVFQLFLIVSGNLSFLNWLTIAIAVACFDDEALARFSPRRLVRAVPDVDPPPSRAAQRTAIGLVAIVALLSISPVLNMLSPDQRMNASFEPLHLVSTYGAFGSVRRERHELVIEGTRELERPRWEAYALPCQPGPVARRPCFVAPWQLRLDWQIWFAADGEPDTELWLLRLVRALLLGQRDVLRLFDVVPFPASEPPRAIRIQRFRYRFAPAGSSDWWVRDREETWLEPLTLEDFEPR